MGEFKRFAPEEKAEIVLLALRSPGHVSEICRERGIAPVTFSRWKKTYILGGMDAMRQNRKVLENELALENQKLKAIIGQLFVELEYIKKKLGMTR